MGAGRPCNKRRTHERRPHQHLQTHPDVVGSNRHVATITEQQRPERLHGHPVQAHRSSGRQQSGSSAPSSAVNVSTNALSASNASRSSMAARDQRGTQASSFPGGREWRAVGGRRAEAPPPVAAASGGRPTRLGRLPGSQERARGPAPGRALSQPLKYRRRRWTGCSRPTIARQPHSSRGRCPPA